MNKITVNTILIIAGIGLAIAGIIFLLAAIFDDNKNNLMLVLALCCSLLSNLFNILRIQFNKSK